MEPVFMILSQSAATAACIAIDRTLAVQDVPYAKLRERLLADGQVLETPPQMGKLGLIPDQAIHENRLLPSSIGIIPGFCAESLDMCGL